MPTRIYQYGLLQPVGDGAKVLYAQLRASAQYYNALVENERARRTAVRDLQRSISPEVVALDDEILKLETQLWDLRETINKDKSQRGYLATFTAWEASADAAPADAAPAPAGAKRRPRKTDARKADPVMSSAAEGIKAQLKLAYKALRAQTKLVRDSEKFRHGQSQIDVYAHAQALKIYGDHVTWGVLSSGVADDVRSDAFPAACKPSAVKAGSRPKPYHMRPEFRRFQGSGIAGLKFRDGVRCAVVGGLPGEDCSNWLKIDAVDPRAWQKSTPRGERKRLSRTTCHIRLGKSLPNRETGDKGERLWVSFPMVMHRPLPPSGEVRGARIMVERRHGKWPRYYLQLTVSEPEVLAPLAETSDAVGIDLGWRRTEGGRIRIAACSDGTEVFMNERQVQALDKADSIKAIRAKLQDEMQAALGAMLDNMSAEDLPAAVRRTVLRRSDEETPTPSVPQFRAVTMRWGKSPEKFLRVLRAIRNLETAVPARAAAVAALLAAWHRRDLHLWQYEDGLRRSGTLARREGYRVVAAALARKYQFAIFEDLDIANLAKRGEAESDSNEPRAAQNSRQKGAPSEFRLAVESAFAKTGSTVIRVPAAYTSMRCNDCGYSEPWQNKSELIHTCEGCGAVFDRDLNAAKNIRDAAEGIYSSPEAVRAYVEGRKSKITKIKKPRRKVAAPTTA